jgi:galactose mutarotase-like enzyme
MTLMLRLLCCFLVCAILPHAAVRAASSEITPISKQYLGAAPDGQDVYLYTLTNDNGMQFSVMTYGGIMMTLKTPDREGKSEDIILGYPTLADYIKTGNKHYFGAVIGRYANRIAGGRFVLDGQPYQLSINDGANTLHGGQYGFDKRVFAAEEIHGRDEVGVALTYESKDGEEGFPGNMWVKVIYTLTADNELRIDYEARADRATVVNLTQHNYYNLSGAGQGNILDHVLTIHAGHYTAVNPELIPTGAIASVAGTPLDFTQPETIGARIHADHPQLRYADGYDFNYVLDHQGDLQTPAARVFDPKSGRLMEVYTTQPAIQLYTGNYLDGQDIGKDGRVYQRYYGFSLETQHYPDSPNHATFPSTVLRPGETFRQTTIYKFSAGKA